MINFINSNDWIALSSLILVTIFCFCAQFELSVVSFLSGHTLGKQSSQKRLRLMIDQFIFGFTLMNWLIISSLCLVVYFGLGDISVLSWYSWSVVGLLYAEAVALLLLKIWRPDSANPWINTGLRRFLLDRSKKTRSPSETFSLGLTSAITKTALVLIPLILVGHVLLSLPSKFLVASTIIASSVLSLPLLVFRSILIRQKSALSVQKFVLKNRHFFQSIQIICLLLLACILASALMSSGAGL